MPNDHKNWRERVKDGMAWTPTCAFKPEKWVRLESPFHEKLLDNLQPHLPETVRWTFPDPAITSPLFVETVATTTIGHKVCVSYQLADDSCVRWNCDIFTLRAGSGHIIEFNEGAIYNASTGHTKNGRILTDAEGDELKEFQDRVLNKFILIAELIEEHGKANYMAYSDWDKDEESLGR